MNKSPFGGKANEYVESGSSSVKTRKPSTKKKKAAAESESTWGDAWYHFFRVFAGIRKKEFTAKRKDFDSLGEAWFNMSVQFPFVSKLLIILTPMFALGELMEKFATILEIKLHFGKRKNPEEVQKDVELYGMYDSANSR